MRDLLGRPAGLRYVARSLLAPTLLGARTPGPTPPGARSASCCAHRFDLLDRGVSHVPAPAPTGEVLGVLEDVDVVAATTRSSVGLRTRIARAEGVDGVVAAARGVGPAVVALHDARVAAADVAGITAVVVDAVTRRLVDLAVAELRPPPAPLTWLAPGSQAHREAVPSSDVHSALVLQLRLAHQVEQLRAGRRPEDRVRPRDLAPVARASLREAFRAVAAVQR